MLKTADTGRRVPPGAGLAVPLCQLEGEHVCGSTQSHQEEEEAAEGILRELPTLPEGPADGRKYGFQGRQHLQLPSIPASLAPLVVYSKNRVPSLEEVSQTLRNKGHVSRPLGEDAAAQTPKEGYPTSEVFINQLDRISEEGEPWEALDYHPLIFQNANITFENEETGLSDEETSKSSVEDNLTSKEQPQPGPMTEVPSSSTGEFPSSDESTFTSTESELSVPYEKLMNEYNKADSPRGT